MNQYIPPTPPSRKNKKHNRKKVTSLPENCWVEQPENLPESSRKIELSRGLFAIVDEDDFEFLDQFTWSVKPDGGTCYAVTNVNKTEYKMHRVVMKVNNGKEITIDHENHNGLDNRKSNLRIVSRSENQENRRKRAKKRNRFIGVLPGLTKDFTVWVPMRNGKRHKKNFSDEVEAARYYDYMIVKERGLGTKTNLSEGRFTQKELDSFSGKISNPIEQVEIAADIKYQPNMICLTSEEFDKMIAKLSTTQPEQQVEAFNYTNRIARLEKAEKDLASANHRVTLLEEQLRVTESELKRALSQ